MVIDGLCRLLIGTEIPIIIVDHDRVEEHNLLRQNFHPEDIGKFKSQVLAERYARVYGRKIGYIVQPFDRELSESHSSIGESVLTHNCLIIGCVDGAQGRQEIARAINYSNWWLDAGNGFHSGQVLFGNVTEPGAMRGAFHEISTRVEGLPAPSLQMPSLLVPAEEPVKQDCAQAVRDNDQSPVINQAMATLILDFVYKLFIGKLYYMGVYLDLEAGTLRRVSTDPIVVSRMLSIPVKELMGKEEARTNIRR